KWDCASITRTPDSAREGKNEAFCFQDSNETKTAGPQSCLIMEGTIKIALVGAGMFGGDVHARAYADLQRAGISPQLGRVGLDGWARDLATIKFELVAIATRTEKSARRAQANFKNWTGYSPKTYSDEKPWLEIVRDFP